MESDTAESSTITAVQPSILETPIADLGLRIEGSLIEPFLKRLARELQGFCVERLGPQLSSSDEQQPAGAVDGLGVRRVTDTRQHVGRLVGIERTNAQDGCPAPLP